MNLTVHDPKFEPSSSLVGGTIFWTIGGTAFPCKGWNDNINVLLGWWLSALLTVGEHSCNATMSFMEGPYEVVISPASPGFVLARENDFGVEEVVSIQHLIDEIEKGIRVMTHNLSTEQNKLINDVGFSKVLSRLRKIDWMKTR